MFKELQNTVTYFDKRTLQAITERKHTFVQKAGCLIGAAIILSFGQLSIGQHTYFYLLSTKCLSAKMFLPKGFRTNGFWPKGNEQKIYSLKFCYVLLVSIFKMET